MTGGPWSMDPVHESGAWTWSKVGGPCTPGPCFVLTHFEWRDTENQQLSDYGLGIHRRKEDFKKKEDVTYLLSYIRECQRS